MFTQKERERDREVRGFEASIIVVFLFCDSLKEKVNEVIGFLFLGLSNNTARSLKQTSCYFML